MGIKQWQGIDLQPGVEVRKKGAREVVRIRFWYRNVRCPELSLTATPANVEFANRKIVTVKEEIEKNLFVYANHFPDSKRLKLFGGGVTKLTVGAALDARKDRDSTNLEDSTWAHDKGVIEHHIKPKWGSTQMALVTTKGLRDWCTDLFKTGILRKTVANILCPMRRVFAEAALDGDIKDNPFNNLDLKVLTPKGASSDYRRDPFDAAERSALLQHAVGRNEQLGNLLQAWWWTGLSASEIIALRWSCIDFVNNTIEVKAARVLKERGNRTKNLGRKRLVDMLHLARKALIAQKAHTWVDGGDGFVFHNPVTRKPWTSSKALSNPQGVFQGLCKKAGVRYRGPNQCRHTFAGMMIAGVPDLKIAPMNLWDIAAQLGHFKQGSTPPEPNIEMLVKHYGSSIRNVRPDGTKPAKPDWSRVTV